MEITNEEREYIKAKCVLCFQEKKLWEQMESQLYELNHELYDIKGVRFDGIGADEHSDVHKREKKLASMFTKKAQLLKALDVHRNLYVHSVNEMGLQELSPQDFALLGFVSGGKSYAVAGLEFGYTKKQIYRKVNGIYKAIFRKQKEQTEAETGGE